MHKPHHHAKVADDGGVVIQLVVKQIRSKSMQVELGAYWTAVTESFKLNAFHRPVSARFGFHCVRWPCEQLEIKN